MNKPKETNLIPWSNLPIVELRQIGDSYAPIPHMLISEEDKQRWERRNEMFGKFNINKGEQK